MGANRLSRHLAPQFYLLSILFYQTKNMALVFDAICAQFPECTFDCLSIYVFLFISFLPPSLSLLRPPPASLYVLVHMIASATGRQQSSGH